MSFEQPARQVLEKIRSSAPHAQAEVFLLRSSSRTSEWSEGLPENQVHAETQGLGLRIIQDGRLGVSYTNGFTAENLDTVVKRALDSAKLTAADPLLELPPHSQVSRNASLDLVDASLTADSWEERAHFLKTLESKVRAKDARISKILRGSYSEGYAEVGVFNSLGTADRYDGTTVSAGLVCVAIDANETQMGWASHASRHFSDLQILWAVDKAIENTVALLGGRRLPSGRYDLVLDPVIAAEVLQLLAGALRGDQVVKGKSFFATKKDQAVASAHMTIVDDGGLKRALGSSPFDAEGWPTQRTVLIDKGVLRGFVFDSYNARKAGARSTGNASRSSYKGAPEPDMTNFYLEPGTRSPADIVASVQSGIYVRNVMGLHTVDTISGDFSLGLTGQFIENGVCTHAVRGVTMAGNLLDLLRNVEAVGSDLIFSGSIGSPTLWIKDISIGGD